VIKLWILKTTALEGNFIRLYTTPKPETVFLGELCKEDLFTYLLSCDPTLNCESSLAYLEEFGMLYIHLKSTSLIPEFTPHLTTWISTPLIFLPSKKHLPMQHFFEVLLEEEVNPLDVLYSSLMHEDNLLAIYTLLQQGYLIPRFSLQNAFSSLGYTFILTALHFYVFNLPKERITAHIRAYLNRFSGIDQGAFLDHFFDYNADPKGAFDLYNLLIHYDFKNLDQCTVIIDRSYIDRPDLFAYHYTLFKAYESHIDYTLSPSAFFNATLEYFYQHHPELMVKNHPIED